MRLAAAGGDWAGFCGGACGALCSSRIAHRTAGHASAGGPCGPHDRLRSSRCGFNDPAQHRSPTHPLLREQLTRAFASLRPPASRHQRPLPPATAMRPSSSRLPRSSSARSLSSCAQQQGRAPSKPAELLRALPPFARSDEALAAPSPTSLLDSPRKQVGRRAGAMGPRSCWRDCAAAAAGSWSVAIGRAAALVPSLQVHRAAPAPPADHAALRLGAGDSDALLGASQALTRLLDATAAAIAAASSHVPSFVQGVLARLFPAASSISAAMPSPGAPAGSCGAARECALKHVAQGASRRRRRLKLVPAEPWRPVSCPLQACCHPSPALPLPLNPPRHPPPTPAAQTDRHWQ